MKKDYNNMTQEELNHELAEIVRKNYEQGVVLLDRDYNFISFQKLSQIEKIEDIDYMIAILRSMKYSPNLKPVKLMALDVPTFTLIFPSFSSSSR